MDSYTYTMSSQILFTEIGQAIELLQSGNLALAEKKLKYLLEKNKDNPLVMEVLSAVYLAQNKKSQAINLLRKLVIKNSQSTSILFNIAKALDESNEYGEALKYYQQLLTLEPDHIDGLLSYSKCLIEINRLEEASFYIKKLLEKIPNYKPALINLGVIYKKNGHYEQAIKIADKLLEQDPSLAEVYSNKGGALYSLKRYAESIIEFNKALEIKPNFEDALVNKANALFALGNYKNAIIEFNKLLSIKPNELNGLLGKGNSLNEMGEYQEAITEFEKAIKINPNLDLAMAGKGNALIELGNYEAGLKELSNALKINPSLEVAKLNQLVAHIYQKNDNEVLRLFENLHDSNKENSEFLFRYSLYCLLQKKFSEGWLLYEKRFDTKGYKTFVPKTIPLWKKINFNTKLLIIGDQGIGDQILFSSMLNEVDSSIKKTLLINRKLKKIYQRSFPDINLLDENTTIVEKEFDGYIYLSSLGQFFRPDINSFENLSSSYLVDDKTLTQTLKNKIKFNKKAICGISWKSTNTKLGSQKNLTLEEMISIFNLDINFVNLQYGDVKEEIENFRKTHHIPLEYIDNINLYEDVDAALSIINSCDFIITTSNTTAHLAGAIGKETLVLVPYSRGRLWYWNSSDGKCLWYPTITIFEQQKDGDWSVPLLNIKQYIQEKWLIN